MEINNKNNLKTLINEKDLDKKISELAHMFYKNKDDNEIIFQLIVAISKYDKYRSRAKELLVLLKEKYNDKFINFELGKLEVQDNNYESARGYFESVLDKEPYDKYALLELGKLEFNLKHFDNAEHYFKKILSHVNKHDKYALFWMGKIKMTLNEFDKALIYFNKTLYYMEKYNDNHKYNELNIDCINLCFGIIQRYSGNYDEAKKYFLAILENNNKDKYALLELAKLEKDNNNFENAKHYLFKILEYYPNDKYALYELSIVSFEIGNFDEAMNYLKKYFKIIGKDEDGNIIFNSLFKIAKVEESKGNIDGAEKLFFEASKYRKNSSLYLALSKLQLKKCDLDKAEYYLKYYNDNDYNVSILAELGYFEIKKCNYEKALEYLNQIKKEDHNANSLIYLITVYSKLKNFEMALYYFIKLVNSDDIKYVNSKLIRRMEVYIKYNLNLPIVDDNDDDLLFTKQLINYDKKFALNHAKKDFFEEDVEHIFLVLQEKINNSNPCNSYGSSDYYVFKLDEPIINVYGEAIDYIGATTIMDSDKILYFYSSSESELYFKTVKNKLKKR